MCALRRVGGRESEQWRAGMELARQGDIANLRVVALDIVSAPADGAARCGHTLGYEQVPHARATAHLQDWLL